MIGRIHLRQSWHHQTVHQPPRTKSKSVITKATSSTSARAKVMHTYISLSLLHFSFISCSHLLCARDIPTQELIRNATIENTSSNFRAQSCILLTSFTKHEQKAQLLYHWITHAIPPLWLPRPPTSLFRLSHCCLRSSFGYLEQCFPRSCLCLFLTRDSSEAVLARGRSRCRGLVGKIWLQASPHFDSLLSFDEHLLGIFLLLKYRTGNMDVLFYVIESN